jgi:hypothetical protein
MSRQEEDPLWAVVESTCERAIRSLSERVIAAWPNAHIQSGHYSTPVFPARFWATFTDALREEKEAVDVSIDFKLGEQVVEVTADVAYESGEILSMLPVQEIPLNKDGSLAADKAREVITRVAEYAQEQWELIGTSLNA